MPRVRGAGEGGGIVTVLDGVARAVGGPPDGMTARPYPGMAARCSR